MFCLKNIRSYIGILVTGIVLTSCSGMLYTSIDVLRPARVSFPVDVNQLLVINNTLPQPHTYGHITELFNENQRNVSVETDSLAVFALASFSESIIDKEFFISVSLAHESVNKGADFFSVTLPDQAVLQGLADAYGANGIIALNRILVHDQVGELYNQENASFIAYLEARYEHQWSIHFPQKNQIFSLTTKDTVYWESESFSRQRALSGLPDRRDALIDGALISGQRVVDKFIPYWEKIDRYLFDMADKSFKQGLDAVYMKDWDGAIKIWTALLDNTKSQSKKAKYAHNLSVMHEIKGEVKEAYAYSNLALEYFLNSVILEYKQLMFVVDQNESLKGRMNELEVLNKQLGE